MWRCSAILLLCLELWAGRVSAQEVKPYSLTVAVHPLVKDKMNAAEADDILKCASAMLQGDANVGLPNCPVKDINPPNHCNVEFTFKGFLDFPSSAPLDITNKDDLEAVHKVPGDVKVVRSITFCAAGLKPTGYAGCAWRPAGGPRTVIVARTKFLPALGPALGAAIWTHEFGHTTGLPHRYQKGKGNLMTPCDIQVFSWQINQNECNHFRAGPKAPPYRPIGRKIKTCGP